MAASVDLLDPRRSAHASIRGYLYQSALAVKHWLALGDGDVLLCEGDEDLDRIIRGERTAEQVKSLVGTVNVRDAPVRESLRNFLVGYVARRRRGETQRFVFTTTAGQRPQRTGDLPVDVLKAWGDRSRRADVVASVRSLVAAPEAVAWLDAEDGRWDGFVEAVEWNFDARCRARSACRGDR